MPNALELSGRSRRRSLTTRTGSPFFARACAPFLIVEGANLVKLHHDSPTVSYLTYPAFEVDPHPALAASVVVHLRVGKLDARDFRTSSNPPILHRKELFLPSTSPLRAKFARLTAQEERAGLYERSDTIGTRDGWARVLAERGVRLAGHRVVQAKASR